MPPKRRGPRPGRRLVRTWLIDSANCAGCAGPVSDGAVIRRGLRFCSLACAYVLNMKRKEPA